MKSRTRLNEFLYSSVLLCACSLLWSCATTSGSGGRQYGPEPIPEGKGRLFLQAGGINELNFYVEDQVTGEEVYVDMPRLGASSPSAYETGSQENRLVTDLDPGIYKVVVNTDVKDNVVVEDVQIKLGEEKHVQIQVGRFQLTTAGPGLGGRMPFLIMDYRMRTVLGRAMTSTQVRHFIVPTGSYKIRMENSPAGLDEMRSVDVGFGRITHVRIDTEPTQEPGQETGQEQP